jgi:hypothetical protein
MPHVSCSSQIAARSRPCVVADCLLARQRRNIVARYTVPQVQKHANESKYAFGIRQSMPHVLYRSCLVARGMPCLVAGYISTI